MLFPSSLLCCWRYVDYRGLHYDYRKDEEITTTILLPCKSLVGNFGTSILVGVTLTCTTQLNIIADQVRILKGTWQRNLMSLASWIIRLSEPCGVWVNFFHFSLSFSLDSTHLRYIFQLLMCPLFLNMIKCTSLSPQNLQVPVQFSIQTEEWTTTKPLKTQRIQSRPSRGHPPGSPVRILTQQHHYSVTDLAERCVSGGSNRRCWVLSNVSIFFYQQTIWVDSLWVRPRSVWSHGKMNLCAGCVFLYYYPFYSPMKAVLLGISLIPFLLWFKRESETLKLETSPVMSCLHVGLHCCLHHVHRAKPQPNLFCKKENSFVLDLLWNWINFLPAYIPSLFPVLLEKQHNNNRATKHDKAAWSSDEF